MEDNKPGVILAQPTITDWSYQVFSPLEGIHYQPHGQWDALLPAVEYQSSEGIDSWMCVSYSLLNCLEMLYIRQTGVEINWSDTFLGKISGTIPGVGNYLATVFDTARKEGLVLQSSWANFPEPYRELTQEIKDEAKKFLNDWLLYREWVIPTPEYMKLALMDAPLQVVVNNGTHAVACYGYEDGEHWKCYDHYYNIKKQYPWDYDFRGVLKPTLSKKTNNTMTIKNNTLLQLVQGNGDFGLFLDDKIIVDDLSKITASFLVRNNGKTADMVKAVTLEDWTKYPHYDLKGNKLN